MRACSTSVTLQPYVKFTEIIGAVVEAHNGQIPSALRSRRAVTNRLSVATGLPFTPLLVQSAIRRRRINIALTLVALTRRIFRSSIAAESAQSEDAGGRPWVSVPTSVH